MESNNKPVIKLKKLSKTDNEIKQLHSTMENTTIRLNDGRKNSGHGRTQVFGYINNRRGFHQAKNNFEYPELYKELKTIGKKIDPLAFNAIQVNDNYQCKKHIDKNNVGKSMLFSIGDYDGGDLVIYEDEDHPQKYNIAYSPILFDGSEYYHEVLPIKHGHRYSFVFFLSKAPQRISKGKK